ncbi:MAG: acyl carrier protein [Filifactoraceae bacterium]
MFEKIQTIIAEQLAISPTKITRDTNLIKDLEADSLDAVEIIMAIEDEFSIEIPEEDIENIEQVSDLIKIIEKLS